MLLRFNLLMIFQHEGKGEPSLLSRRLGRGGYSIDSHPDEEVIKDVAWVAYAGVCRTFVTILRFRNNVSGGAETSHLALSTFFAAMLLHPEVQSKGQKELDAHIGSRLPEFEDLPHLPYVRAIMLEVLRSGPRSLVSPIPSRTIICIDGKL